ncbi:MAG: Mu transposase domain-containing protein, partial [Solimonas sp.]
HVGTDNSSAAPHEISGGRRGYNPDYLDLCSHYGLAPITINVGCPHEQGDIESANRHLKRRLEQHLLLRGSREFASAEAYDAFVGAVMESANAGRQTRLVEELAVMRPLPPSGLAEYRELSVRVSVHSTIRVKKVSYSVPSRWIGQRVRIEQYESELKVFLGRELVQRLPRHRGDRGAVIDFRHVVGPLLRKPGAFANYQHREQLYPSPGYRAAYDRLVADHGSRHGVVEYLQVLRVAAEHGVEPVAERLAHWLGQKGKWTALTLAGELTPRRDQWVNTPELVPELGSYDELLGGEVGHVG